MAMANTIAKAQAKTVTNRADKSLKSYVQDMLPEIAKALPSVMTPERFMRITLTALSSTPKLAECTRDSFLGSMMQAAQLGLEPNTPLGQAYLIPYRNGRTGKMECQFQLGYKGMLDLAYRSGEVTFVKAHEVCENDVFEYSFGLEPTLTHVPAQSNRGEVIAYYAVWKGKTGGFGFEVMSRDECVEHRRKYSKASNSPWDSNFDAMAKKTVLKKALKYAPVASDFARGVAADSTILHAVKNEDDGLLEVDSVIVEPADAAETDTEAAHAE